jgi:hypothetical protein
MSNPQPARLKKTPPRAEPLQPDRPGSGDDQQAVQDESEARSKDSTAQQKRQSDTALHNVREGYD